MEDFHQTGAKNRSKYNPDAFNTLSQYEHDHFWFRSRNLIISSVVDRLVSEFRQGYNVLEVGCGTGFVLKQLEATCKLGHVFGLEMHQEGVAIAKSRVACPVLQGDIHSFRTDKRFAMIGLFDVIEHIEDDVSVLMRCTGLLDTIGGCIVITVPASQRLWSARDIAVGHYRRYTKRSLLATLGKAGLEVSYLTHFMSVLLPAMFLRRVVNRREHADTIDTYEVDLAVSPLSNWLAFAILKPEVLWVSKGHRLPFGTSLLAVARPRT
jgi:2-polyprenyl-3-methyl-5-hydroxy-6-metoxy-1,4-benzoquinol methylase